MEKLVDLFGGIYDGKKVLVTGHTGFKGSWLCLWLREMGVEVMGYALDPNFEPNHFNLLDLEMKSEIADIRDLERLTAAVSDFKPEIIFHLAAQPLVRKSYEQPVETYSTNIMGTVNVLEACRRIDSVKAVVIVTSDKCYDNKEWVWGYRETDSMGGFDPYSSSKGCAELVTQAYRNSFFNLQDFGRKHNVLIASARAGNVIGGGDWAEDRLIPDIMRAASKGQPVTLRNPASTRPWQHVLEPLSGYLLLGQKLLEGRKEYAEAWNFGPEASDNLSVEVIVKAMQHEWNAIQYNIQNYSGLHEANLLQLDCSKAHRYLSWDPVLALNESMLKTAEWYKAFYLNKRTSSIEQLRDYIKLATARLVTWTK